MKIAVIGLGYIGLPTAAMFARAGLDVIGYDINKEVVEALNKGKILISEPGLGELVKEVVENKKLRGVSCLEESDAFIICVPTPINEDKTANLDYVKDAARSISKFLRKGNAVVLESTSPPGTVEDVVVPILAESGLAIGEEVYVAYTPERVLPGKIIQEIVQNDRVVGGINEKSAHVVRDIYSAFVKGNIYTTDSKTAELCKLMENTYRDVNIALANELAIFCEEMGINAWKVVELANKHPRVNIHLPGPGVGGHCLAVDPWFIVEKQKETGIIKKSREINDSMPKHVFNKLINLLPDNAKISILGITYKPNIDDLRESPIVELINLLIEKTNYRLSIHDPYAHKDMVSFSHLMTDSIEDVVRDADILVLGVNHDDYKDMDFERISNLMRTKHVYDTRNFFCEEKLINYGFKTTLLGRD